MRGPRSILPKLMCLAALSWAAEARAFPSYYTDGAPPSTTACTACHTAAVAPLNTCNGCHAHGTHGTSAKSSINLAASTDKTTYAPGETVTVTVTGGYQSGWVRVNLYDQGMTQLARSSCTPGGLGGCNTSVFPVVLTTTAPATPGTYDWRAAWYGNVHEAATGVTSPACGATVTPPCFRQDPNNAAAGAVHGEEIVAVPDLHDLQQRERDVDRERGSGRRHERGVQRFAGHLRHPRRRPAGDRDRHLHTDRGGRRLRHAQRHEQ